MQLSCLLRQKGWCVSMLWRRCVCHKTQLYALAWQTPAGQGGTRGRTRTSTHKETSPNKTWTRLSLWLKNLVSSVMALINREKHCEANDAKQEITKTARGDSSRLSCEVRTLDGLCLCDKKKTPCFHLFLTNLRLIEAQNQRRTFTKTTLT